MTQRFMTEDGQPSDVEKALKAAAAQAESDPSIVEVVFVVPTLKDLPSTTLAGAIGEGPSKKLAKGEPVTFHNLPARATSVSKFVRPRQSALVVAVYADRKTMNLLDEAVGAHTVIAVPHVLSALDAWKNAWSPQVLGQPTAPAPAQTPVKDGVVTKALEDLTSSINLSNAALGVQDRARAEEVLRSLRCLDHHQEPAANLRAWAVGRGWKPKAADELQKMAMKFFSAKTKPKLAAGVIERARQRWL
ncbi:hypothetical protein D9M72_229380 [compost metagenome]